MQNICPEFGSRFGQRKAALSNVWLFPGGMCLLCSRGSPIPASGRYPAGGGIVQTSSHVLLLGGNCHMDPGLRLPGQAAKAIGSRTRSDGVTVLLPSSTWKVFVFFPCVFLLSITCRQNNIYLSSAFSSSAVCRRETFVSGYLKLGCMAWIHKGHFGSCCC